MGRAGSGARIALLVGVAAALGAAALAGCATVAEPAAASTIRELTVTTSDTNAECAAMLWPVDGPLSSPFGLREGRTHEGIDLAVAEDTPVRAACDGVVAYAGNGLRGYGNVVIVQHGGAVATLYAHNHRLAVRQGDRIARGQIIAQSGQTGHVTAPHLHFEVRKGSIALDPLGYLSPNERSGD
jgi:murein DD-endopeptidase MepM/ murein hydrolase activator NlpD